MAGHSSRPDRAVSRPPVPPIVAPSDDPHETRGLQLAATCLVELLGPLHVAVVRCRFELKTVSLSLQHILNRPPRNRAMESDVLWKAAMKPRLPTGLGKRPPPLHPRFPQLPQPLLENLS